jgi:hypothetical protein
VKPPDGPTGDQEFSMLTFAAMPAPADAQGAAPMSEASSASGDHVPASKTAMARPAASTTHAHYWPCELLNAFVLKMAASGHCVSTAMMLGDRGYALEQLNIARTTQDASLRALAARLQTYFDAAAPQACALVARMEMALA